MPRIRQYTDSEYTDYRHCVACGQEYSADESWESSPLYFDFPYSYDRGSSTHCLACWLGVGPNDFPECYELPTLVMLALVTINDKTKDGQHIDAVKPAWIEIVKLIRDDPDALFKIPPRKLEELIAGAYERRGFDRVILTPASGDHGRDVIAEKSGWGCVRFVDQVKAYKPSHLVTAEEVRALGFVMLADYATSKGIVTTTSDFAPRIGSDPLLQPYLGTRIELINGTKLLKLLGGLLPSDDE